MNEKVLSFISRFNHYEKDNVLLNTFTQGFCYYFSIILQERFGGEIYYEYIEGHFYCKIDSQYYDIRGNRTEFVDETKLINKDEYLQVNSIITGCILKED